MSGPDLKGDVHPDVKAMVLAQPGFEIGERMRSLYVSRAKGSLPGKRSSLYGDGPSFRSVFYPNWSPSADEALIGPATGLDDSWWSDFATVVLCHAISYQTDALGGLLLGEKISGDVRSRNASLRANSAALYGRLLLRYLDRFREAAAKLDLATARVQYRKALIDNIAVYELWYAAGQWKNPDWDLFHHYTKLMALGASAADVDGLIDELIAAGLPIPPTVSKSNWRSYAVYFQGKQDIDHADVDNDARNGILEMTFPPGIPGGRTNGNAREFVANSQPGDVYFGGPMGGSCFSGATQVLTADGTGRRIDQLSPGCRVATPRGERAVAQVMRPLLLGRSLYTINGADIGLTSAHPVVNAAAAAPGAAGVPAFLAIDPALLKASVPSFTEAGVGSLQCGATVLGCRADKPQQPSAITVTSVDEVASPDDGRVYDVILELNDDRPPEFYVGDGDTWILVTTEMPLLALVPYATIAVAAVLSSAVPSLTHALLQPGSPLDDRETATRLFERLAELRAGLSGVLHRAAVTVTTPGHQGADADRQPTPDSLEHAAEYAERLLDHDEAQLVAFGAIFESIAAALGDELEAAIELGWRSFEAQPDEHLAFTLFSVRVDDGLLLADEGRLRAEVKAMDGAEARETHVVWSNLGRDNGSFVHHFDQVIYLDAPYQPNSLTAIEIDIFLEQAPIPLLRATCFLPHDLGGSYRRFTPVLLAADNRVRGDVQCDVRLLSMHARNTEDSRRPLWDHDAKARFAEELGTEIGQLVNAEAAYLPA